eukprot:gene8459-10390_t
MKYLILTILLLASLSFTFATRPSKSSIGTPSEMNCDICNFIVGYVEQYGKNLTVSELVQHVYDDCDEYFGSYAVLCQGIVKSYTIEIIKMYNDGQKPGTICKTLDLCSKSSGSGSTGTGTGSSGSSGTGMGYF